MNVFGVSDVATVDTFAVEGGYDSFASRIIGDTAHKDGFVAVAGESGGRIGGAAASTEVDFVDVDFATELNLVEVAALVGAKIVMVNKIDVL